MTQDYKTNIKHCVTRIQDFLVCFCANSRSAKTFLEILTTHLVNLLKYVQHFTIMLYETSGPSNNAMALKSLSGRLRVTFLYQPMGDPSHPDIAVQHAFFSNIGSFSAAIEAYHVFDLIYQALLKIKNQETLEAFVSSFERNNIESRGINQGQLQMVRQQLKLQQLFLDRKDLILALEEKGIRSEGSEQFLQGLRVRKDSPQMYAEDEDIEDEPHIQTTYLDTRKESTIDIRNLQVKLFIGENEVPRYSTIFEVNSKNSSEDGLLIRFFFEVENEKNEPVQPVILSNLCQDVIKLASNTPLPVTEKVYTPICLLKLIHFLNSNIQNFLSVNSVLFNSALTSPCSTISSSSFVSFKLSALLGKQTSDMLAMIGGMAPD